MLGVEGDEQIGCPDCEHECLRVSFDWAQLSLLGDGGSTAHPRGRRYRDSVTSRDQSGRRPSCEAWTPWDTFLLLHSAGTAPRVLPHKPCELGEGLAPWFGVFLWHLALTPLIPSPSHPRHLSNNGQCKKTDQGPEEPGFRAQCTIRIRDQAEMRSGLYL